MGVQKVILTGGPDALDSIWLGLGRKAKHQYVQKEKASEKNEQRNGGKNVWETSLVPTQCI